MYALWLSSSASPTHAQVPPGFRVVYFPHVEGARYCAGEFHEVILTEADPLIVHPCYIRDANAPRRIAPPPPGRANVEDRAFAFCSASFSQILCLFGILDVS
jgi:hypothetical protein